METQRFFERPSISLSRTMIILEHLQGSLYIDNPEANSNVSLEKRTQIYRDYLTQVKGFVETAVQYLDLNGCIIPDEITTFLEKIEAKIKGYKSVDDQDIQDAKRIAALALTELHTIQNQDLSG